MSKTQATLCHESVPPCGSGVGPEATLVTGHQVALQDPLLV